jgi:putative nucleotidyltransferase with HDIG domain
MVLREAVDYFDADAAAVVGDDVQIHTRDDVAPDDAHSAVMRVSLDAVRAGSPISQGEQGPDGVAIAVPLRVKGQLRSVVCLWRAEGTFPDDQLHGLQLLAKIIEMSLENRGLLDDVRSQLQGTLQALAGLVDLRQPEYSQHSARVAETAVGIGVSLGLTERDVQDLRLAAILHDVGMLEVPRSILAASRPLSTDELAIVRKHPAAGASIVKAAHFNERVQHAVMSHHERLDGTGYPNGLRGDQVPLLARVLTVADAYCAMTAKRPYRQAKTESEALDEIRRGVGAAYDAAVFQALVRVSGHRPGAASKLDEETRSLLEQAI